MNLHTALEICAWSMDLQAAGPEGGHEKLKLAPGLSRGEAWKQATRKATRDFRGLKYNPDTGLCILTSEEIGELHCVIVRRGSRHCVVSEDRSRNLGCGPSRKWARTRLRQVEYFKRKKA